MPEPTAANIRSRARRLKTVLVATSLDPTSETVVEAGAAIARAANARLVLVHALSWPALTTWLPPADVEGAARAQRQQEHLLAEQARNTRLDGVETRVAHGVHDRVIATVAREVSADLIVVGAVTNAGVSGRLLGSTAEHVARTAWCPILVVRGRLEVPVGSVLAPVDLSHLSGDAFSCGLELLREVNGDEPTKVTALFVLSPEQRGAPQFGAEQIERLAREELERVARDSAGASGCEVEAQMVVGEPRAAILEEVESGTFDLALLGTRGQGGIHRVFGSVVAHVLRRSRGSVLLVPPGPALGRAIADAIDEQITP